VLTVRVGSFGNYIGSRRDPEKGPRVSVVVGVGIGAGAGIGWVQVTPLDSSELSLDRGCTLPHHSYLLTNNKAPDNTAKLVIKDDETGRVSEWQRCDTELNLTNRPCGGSRTPHLYHISR